MNAVLSGLYRVCRAVFIGVALVAAAAVFIHVTVPWHHSATDAPLAKESTENGDQVRRSGVDGIILPANMSRKMGLRVATAVVAKRPIKLPPFQGCLALDNNALARVRSRLAGEVVTVAPFPESPEQTYPPPGRRPFRTGDRVRKGDLLAVVWSKDLGEKKSELLDAISKLRADTLALTRAKQLLEQGVGPERNVREAQRVVESDRVALDRAERTLLAWGLSANELASIRDEATKLADVKSKRSDPTLWARVEVRAPLSGVILEKNLAEGDIVDTSTDLFKIGDLSHLAVWAHVYEEDLPLLQALPKPIQWKIKLAARPGVGFEGTLDHVGELIDPNQHTALVSGRVENPEGLLKVGQFVTLSVDLPPPSGEIELPADAVIEDGRESVVFIQTDTAGEQFVRKEVQVVRRLRDAIYVRADPSGLRPGQRVVTDGALLLREALEGLPHPVSEPVVEKPRVASGRS